MERKETGQAPTPRYARNRKRFRRSDKHTLGSIEVTTTDRDIFRALLRYRFLRGDHLVQLLGASEEKLKRRLRVLFDHQFVDRIPEPWRYYHRGGSASVIYGLGPLGARVLREHDAGDPHALQGKLHWVRQKREMSDLFLKHTLLVGDIMAKLEAACRASGTVQCIAQDTIIQAAPAATRASDMPVRWQVTLEDHGTPKTLGMQHDQLFGLRFLTRPPGWQEMFFALEADRGTMPVSRATLEQSSIYRKLRAIQAAKTQGLYASRYALPVVRLLTVTTTPERIRTMVAMIAETRLDQTVDYHPDDFCFLDTATFLEAPDVFTLAWWNGAGECVSPMQVPPVADIDQFFALLRTAGGQRHSPGGVARDTVSITERYDPITPGRCRLTLQATATLGTVSLEFAQPCGIVVMAPGTSGVPTRSATNDDALSRAAAVKRQFVAQATALGLRVRFAQPQ